MKLPFFRRRKRSSRVVVMERRQWFLGAMATVLVAIVWWVGGLDFLERQTFDWRTRWFWRFNEPPSSNIAIVALDDASIDSIGRWPWPRSRLAAVLDEFVRAEVAVAALDLLLDDPEDPILVRIPDPAAWEFGSTAPKGDRVKEVDGDRLLAEAIEAHGNIVVAANFQFGEKADEDASREAANRDQQFRMSLEAMFTLLEAQKTLMDVDLFDRAAEEDAVRGILRQLIGRDSTEGPEFKEVQRKFRAARTLLRASERSSIKAPVTIKQWARSFEPRAPVPRLANSAALLANVSFDSYDPDGLTRRIPILVQHRDRLWPSLGLAAVLAYWGASAESLRLDGDELVVDLRGSERRIQLSRAVLQRRAVDGLVAIPWPRGTLGKDSTLHRAAEERTGQGLGPSVPSAATPGIDGSTAPASVEAETEVSGWEFQFYDLGARQRAEVRAGRLYEPTMQGERLKKNIESLSRSFEIAFAREYVTDTRRDEFRAAARWLLANEVDVDSPEWQEYREKLHWMSLAAQAEADNVIGGEFRRDDTPEALKRAKMADITHADVKALLETSGLKPGEEAYTETYDKMVALLDASNLSAVIWSEIDLAEKSIRTIRAELKARLKGKIVFFGWTATGQTADFVATSIHPRTPGVHVHAAIANAVQTGAWKRDWLWWANLGVLAFLGFIGSWIGVRANVLTAPIAVVAVLCSWFAFNGILLWDLNQVYATVSGTAVACAGGWLAVLLHRLLVEQRDRKVTEERFKSYVSPAVVDILVNNPALSTMKPGMRDMSVMFSDVADFTTTSERLGPELLAKCLSKYLKEMTEILQKNRGTLDKYLGDGIMCFWNAPLDDGEHARHACQTAVQMIGRLEELNDSGAFEEAGRLKVRIGLCTGPCMVGDFGNPPRNSNYTLLGDTANFAARLEGANKFFGTRILGTQRVKDQAGPDIRWRPVGKVFVKGKKEADQLYELIGPLNPHGPATDDWIDLTSSAVDDYAAGRFDDCLKKFAVLGRRFGDEKLAELYEAAIAEWRGRPDYATAFDGSIVLTEK